MLERSHIEGLEILTPSISEHGHGSFVAETRWPKHGQPHLPHPLGYERTVAARAGFLCEPSFDATRTGMRTLRCVQGEIFVAVIDVRRDSRTFGQAQTLELSASNLRVIHVPISLACGYLVTSDTALLDERLSHDPQSAWQWLDWQDPRLQIDWPEAAFTFAPHNGPSLLLHEMPLERLPICIPATAGAQPKAATHSQTDTQYRRSSDRLMGQSKSRDSDPAPLMLSATIEPKPKYDTYALDDHRPQQPQPTTHRLRAVHHQQRDERILVLGCYGQLGQDLCRELGTLGTVVGACRGPALSRSQLTVEVDLSRPASLRQAIRSVQPTLIVNACAMTDVDACEAQPRAAQLINATAPMLVADEARALEIPIVHFCTALVYGGAGQSPWHESDSIQPNCHYARTKAIGTEAVRNSNAPHLVLRTSWLYSSHGRSFIQSLIDQAKTQESLVATADEYGTPTPSAWLARATAKLLCQAQGSLADWLDVNGGLLHATPEGFASRREVAEHILNVCRSSGHQVSARSVRSTVARPAGLGEHTASNCKLDSARLAALLGGTMPRWQAQLTEHIRGQVAHSPASARSIAA